ncbi:hypothetical protein COX25_02055 [bacterium (Candidatus Howlettbacteria) CG23_combo_of_CG06-09_8_20_14_all_37_9]|nr:MAG: hypothetical protein COX25_02055 [bacterium (Candidatus Howlettbacteria) CG23_combo_of_CG06-09_8_20_14_all_37_9]
MSKKKINWFLRFVNKVDKLSDHLKEMTSFNFQDWIITLAFIAGVIYFIQNKSEIEGFLNIIILWLTFFAILWYTRETYWLKQIQQKQFKFELEKSQSEQQHVKRLRSIDLIQEFNKDIRIDCVYVISFTNKNKLKNSVTFPAADRDYNDPAIKLDNVMAFFEKSGLMFRNNLIDFDIFYSHFEILFPRLYNDNLITSVMEEQQKIDEKSYSEVMYLKNLFEKRKSTVEKRKVIK